MAKVKDLKVEKSTTKPRRFKYLCPACTNEAAYMVNADDSFGSMVCRHCGKNIGFDPNQVVKLRQEEVERVNSER